MRLIREKFNKIIFQPKGLIYIFFKPYSLKKLMIEENFQSFLLRLFLQVRQKHFQFFEKIKDFVLKRQNFNSFFNFKQKIIKLPLVMSRKLFYSHY
jgi:hypothetical protein